MGIPSVSSLANMEYMLYGGTSGTRANCPSYTNGYCAQSTLANSTPYYNYGYYNPSFGNVYPNYNYGNTTTNNTSVMGNSTVTPSYQGTSSAAAGSTSFQQGITQEDMDKLADYYANNNALEEGFLGAAGGGLSWMAYEHMQTLFHPINGYNGIKAAEAVFKNVPKAFAEKNPVLIQEAYTALQQATRDTGSQWVKGALRKQINPKDIEPLVEELKTALSKGNVEEIATATERLKGARGMDGWFASLLSKPRTVAERLDAKKASGEIAKNAKNLVNISEGSFTSLLKSGFKKDFWGWMGFEAIASAGKVITAFGKDTETGIKQTGQSLGKAALGASGWCLGRAVGTWAGAKIGAMVGSAVCPGAGTLIGGLVGFTLGSIGIWAGHKLGNWILGKDVADKVEAEKMAKTQSGQVQLLQFAAQKAQEGKTDTQTNAILNKALNV